jgi:hypothetical protein
MESFVTNWFASDLDSCLDEPLDEPPAPVGLLLFGPYLGPAPGFLYKVPP